MFKRSISTLAVSAVLGLAAVSGAHAADVDTAKLPAALKHAHTAGGLDVIKQFDAASGLTGWVVKDKASAKHVIVYTTGDGQLLIAGMALDASGRNVTSMYAEEHIPAPDHTPAFNAFTSADTASVTLGSDKAPAEITVLFDPNCGFCKIMHQLIKPAVEAGELRVRYVPVAILGGDSDRKAAALLTTKDPMKMADALVAGTSKELNSDTTVLAKVGRNTNMMREHGFNGTPAVFYKAKDADGDTIHVANGVPNVSEMFARLGISGQLQKLEADPSLARFIR